MRVVFLGSGAFAVPSLRALLDAGHEVAALVCQPDRPGGRGRGLHAPPTKRVALERGVPMLQPVRVKAPSAVAGLRALAPRILVVVAYGQILSRELLELAPLGAVNVHASLLPLYRGAAPIPWAILRGETRTGVTTMLLDEGLDTGPVLLARDTAIGSHENAAELHDRLAEDGARLLVETLDGLARGALTPQPQDHARATLAPLLHKDDGRLDFSQPAEALARRVRAFHPWPGTHARLGGRVLKVLRAEADPGAVAELAQAGAILGLAGDALVVACGGGTLLRVLEVQPESRRPMGARAFADGARLPAGARLQ